MNVKNNFHGAPLGTQDLNACCQLDQACLGGIWSRTHWQTELEDPRRPGIGLWTTGPGEPPSLVAMARGWLVLDELHITLVAVAPPNRRLGLGRLVLEALLQAGKREGAERATLEVADTNSAAVGLYRTLGFRDAGIRRGYYSNGDDALIQWLRL